MLYLIKNQPTTSNKVTVKTVCSGTVFRESFSSIGRWRGAECISMSGKESSYICRYFSYFVLQEPHLTSVYRSHCPQPFRHFQLFRQQWVQIAILSITANTDKIGNKKMELEALLGILDVHAILLQESKSCLSLSSPMFPDFTTVGVEK